MTCICAYTKDVQLLTGKSEKKCREIIRQVRIQYKKQKHQPVTVYELCDYLGLQIERVQHLLK